MNPVIVLLARAPSAKGKSRLTAHLSRHRAEELRTALLLDTIAVARSTNLPLLISFTPDEAREEMSRLAPDVRLVAQVRGDLGDRMCAAVEDATAIGADAVVLIGSDLPTLPPTYLREAFDRLQGVLDGELGDRADLVLGPTEDGGFYLIGARGMLPDVFDGVEWSGPDVFARVQANARARGISVGVLPQWWDVDDAEDLRRVLGDQQSSVAPQVRAWLRAG